MMEIQTEDSHFVKPHFFLGFVLYPAAQCLDPQLSFSYSPEVYFSPPLSSHRR